MIPMAFIFFVSALAETNRPPFDLSEAESELVAGYQVEYSSTPYLLFMIAEYANIVLMCAMISILFLGGWQPGFPTPFARSWDPDPVQLLRLLRLLPEAAVRLLPVRHGEGAGALATATIS